MRMALQSSMHEQNTKFELGGAITLRDGSDCTMQVVLPYRAMRLLNRLHQKVSRVE